MMCRAPRSPVFPYTTLFRSRRDVGRHDRAGTDERVLAERDPAQNRGVGADGAPPFDARGSVLVLARHVDRKSTRLNSSHRCISYAVFCLKKKNKGCITLVWA